MIVDETIGCDAFDFGHWILSPPQEWTIEVLKDVEKFAELVELVKLLMTDAGFLGGAIVFHPWRLQDGVCVLSPHFHFVGYGDLDNCEIADRYNCVVKQIHSDVRIHSIDETVAYLMQ